MRPEWKPGDIIPKGVLLGLIGDPGRRGRTTGFGQKIGPNLHVELELGPNEREKFRVSQLEFVEESPHPLDQFAAGRLGKPQDLRRLLSFSRMSENLTNVLYSMESSNTEFMPHQFKPVIKFLESPLGRILVADEVGLGKTI